MRSDEPADAVVNVAALRSRVERCRDKVWAELQAESVDGTYWTGELSSSALSTATAVVAISLMDRERYDRQVRSGVEWLRKNVNDDGGFGDTVRSKSNLSTTFLVAAALRIAGIERDDDLARGVRNYIDSRGGSVAILRKYGKDRTFSVPILMMGGLAGLCEWSAIPRLPFELAALPRRFYATVRLPVVSYALPALIAIGQLLHDRNPSRVPPVRWLRNSVRRRTLAKLATLQPSNGGFLEATPLTSFVTMALAALGERQNIVAKRGTGFLFDSQRPDGSWPIDTNLATWMTTLVVNAWGDEARCRLDRPERTLRWLLTQQHREVHPFTGAAPGGWAWTPLPGGVPDADDTAGAIRAILHLRSAGSRAEVDAAADAGLRWLVALTNRDGGTPTFCRGWGTLPFDQSTPELTAHAELAFEAAAKHAVDSPARDEWNRLRPARGRYLTRVACDGVWRPLWFGNEATDDESNPVYGTARVRPALGTIANETAATEAARKLTQFRNSDGGFGAGNGTESSVEETAVALAALCDDTGACSLDDVAAPLRWLCEAIEQDRHQTATPIGLYFANLWYFERLYPHAFALAALNSALRRLGKSRGRSTTAVR